MTDKMSQQNGDNFEAFMFDLLKNKGSAELRYDKSDKKGFSSKKKQNLIRHKKVTHEGGEKYSCERCEFKTTQKPRLTLHIEVHHEGLRFGCDQCDYVALRKDKLRDHILAIHEGIRYGCKMCEYQAKRKDTLLKHEKKCHLQIQDTPVNK